jgi:hypothetical protein
VPGGKQLLPGLRAIRRVRTGAGGGDEKGAHAMNPSPRDDYLSRRGFLHRGAGGAAAVILGGTAAARAADTGRNPFAYDIDRFRRTDPALVGYQRVRRFASPVPAPRRVVHGPSNQLFLAAGTGVTVMDDRGNAVAAFDCSGPVRALAVAADGTLYAGLRDHVEVFDSKGKRLASWAVAQGRPYLTGLAVGERDVFAADAGNRLVWRHDLAGKVIGRIGERDREREIPGLVLPSPFLDVELGADGLLRVNNPGRHRVELYTVEGKLELAWGKASMAIEGFSGCCNPVNLALLDNGDVVTFEKGLPRVKVYSAIGAFECVVAGPEAFADTGTAPAISHADEASYGGLDGSVDSAGRVVVLDLLAAEIQIFERAPHSSATDRSPIQPKASA